MHLYCDPEAADWRMVENEVIVTVLNFEVPAPVTLPKLREVKKGESLSQISRETGLPIGTLRELNYIPPDGSRIYEGETLVLEDMGEEPIRTYDFVLGDPSGLDYRGKAFVDSVRAYYGGTIPPMAILRDQLDHIAPEQVPDYVRQQWVSLVEASQPDEVWLESSSKKPLIVDGLFFGGYKSAEVKIWGRTLCDWKDVRTLQPITRLLAYEYAHVDFGGYRWYLYQLVDCRNGVFVKVPLKRRGEVEVTEYIPPPRRPPTTEIPVERPDPKAPPGRSRDFIQGGVVWTDYVHSRGGGDSQNSLYAGIEWLPRLSHYDGLAGLEDLAIVARVGQAVEDANHVGDYRLGLRTNVYGDNYGWRVDIEGGARYSAGQRMFVEYTNISPTRIHAEEKGIYTDGYGAYGRILGLTPGRGYFDLAYLGGSDLKRQFFAGYTVEPRPFYARVDYGLTERKSQTRRSRNISFPADEMRTTELRGGVFLHRTVLTYASYSWRSFDSTIWSFDWNGWGLGLEWRLNPNWRIRGDYKYFLDAVDRDVATGIEYNTDRHFVQLGTDWSW
ncbi:MAG: LysM peptidoglycan-binding domain-containing protein [bacterium]|nr:LysM peptidoglycan-binding domain-containing protein [bacterium]